MKEAEGQRVTPSASWIRYGAGDRIRTGDPHLGKVMLYKLSYSRAPSSSLSAVMVGEGRLELPRGLPT